jgi:tetratricopeptide (TPR) repeat protein
MRANHPLSLFISSKMQELIAGRRAVQAALAQYQMQGWLWERDAGARPETIRQTYLKAVEECDLYLGLFWLGYGPYTIEEFEQARRHNKPCLIYEKDTDREQRDPRLQAFLDRIGSVENPQGLTICRFQSVEELACRVQEDVQRLLIDRFRISQRATSGSALPPVSLPPRAQTFVGREEELAWLLEHLQEETGKILAVCGPGGMGKTALVAEVLARFMERPDWPTRFPGGIFTSSFYANPSLPVAFEELARTLGEEPGPDAQQAARRALSRRRTLLVFDGVETLPDVQPLRELGGRQVVLLLSRRQSDAPDVAHRLTLDLLSHEEAITLLEHLAGPRAADRSAGERLVQQVGGYPLALQLIGGYLSSRQEEVADYLAWFEQAGVSALHQGEHRSQSVRVLLQRTYDSLTQDEQAIFALLGLLAPAPFPLELVQEVLDLPRRTVSHALGELVNLSVLLRPAQDYLISHPLVHTFAQHCLAPAAETMRLWRERVLRTLLAHVRQSDPYDARAFARWFPHVLPWLKTENVTAEQRLLAASLFNSVGSDAHYQGKYEQAEPLYQRVLAIYEQQLGSQHPDTATSLNNLAELYYSQGKYEQAEPLYQRALLICEQRLGSQHPLTQLVRRNYARLLQEMEGRQE